MSSGDPQGVARPANEMAQAIYDAVIAAMRQVTDALGSRDVEMRADLKRLEDEVRTTRDMLHL